MKQSFTKSISAWYEGEFIFYKNDPTSFCIMTGGWYKRHWTARLVRACVDFWLAEWRIITPIALTCVVILTKLY